jgi:hypothetical protein
LNEKAVTESYVKEQRERLNKRAVTTRLNVKTVTARQTEQSATERLNERAYIVHRPKI